jgi:hypothetical protein
MQVIILPGEGNIGLFKSTDGGGEVTCTLRRIDKDPNIK